MERAEKLVPGVPVTLLIKRRDQVLTVTLTPAPPRKRGVRAPQIGGRDGQ
jgi:hypothetical protein